MFDPVRFGRLASAQWAEQRRAWGWFLGIGTLLLALLYLFFAATVGHEAFAHEGQQMFFLGTLFLSAPVFAGRYFAGMTRAETGLLTLMRPASSFEKWLLALLVVAVGYPLAFCVAFELVNVPAWALAKAAAMAEAAERAAAVAEGATVSGRGPDLADYRLLLPWTLGEDGAHGRVLGVTALLLVGVQGFAVLGSLYFHRTPFLKTILVAVALMIGLSMLSAVLGGSPATVFQFWSTDAQPYGPVDTAASLLFWFGVPALLWLAGLFSLQERELHR